MPSWDWREILASATRWGVVKLDPEQVKFGTCDQVSHVWFWKRTLRSSRDDVGLGWVISCHEFTEPVDQSNVAGGRI
jgi:hypothetical protein